MSDIIESIRRLFVPIHREGYPFIAIGAVLALIIGHYVEPLGWILFVLTLWICYFFRDPARVTPVRDGLVISPADGRVSQIVTTVPPPESGLPATPMTRVSGCRSRSQVTAPASRPPPPTGTTRTSGAAPSWATISRTTVP